jgi:hypothetical protein
MWDRWTEQLVESHIQELLHQAATERLVREAGLSRHTWLHRQICRWLSGLGRLLVGLGQWLQRVGLPPAVMEERGIAKRQIGA